MTLRCALRRRPAFHLLYDILCQPSVKQSQHPSVTDVFGYPFQQGGVRDAVEVALQVGVHHVGGAGLQIVSHFAQGILAAAFGPEAVAARLEGSFEDRFDDHFHGHLHDPILDGGYPQGPGLARCLGNLDPTNRLWLVGAGFQCMAEFSQIGRCTGGEPLDALPVDPGCAAIALDLVPGRFQRGGSVDLVNQAEPLASLDAVVQRRQHAFAPNTTVDPRPHRRRDQRTLFSRHRHCRFFAFALVHV